MFLETSAFFGVSLSVFAYGIGCLLHKKYKMAIFNPLMIAIIITIVVLAISGIDYEIYHASAQYLSFLLTPATVCLAVPLYEKLHLLKRDWKAIFVGIGSGVLIGLSVIFLMCCLFDLSHTEYVTMLPKSITTPIGMGVCDELGGYVTLTVAAIIITGVLGNTFAPFICRVFKIQNPIAKGIAIGTASHAIGTSKAMEMGETEGAMGSLSIVVAGTLTVLAAPIFARLI